MLHKVRMLREMPGPIRGPFFREVVDGLLNLRSEKPLDDRKALEAAVEWLLVAAKHADMQGIPAIYSFTKGFTASYPETTGYIIPTMYRAAEFLQRDDLAQAAGRWAEWLSEIQYQDGSFQAGYVGMNLPGCIFNTGMALFGLVSAFRRTKNERLYESAERASRWLIESQDPDGAWRRNQSKFAMNVEFHAYDVCVSWALLEWHRVSHDEASKAAAERNLDFTMKKAHANAFFDGLEMAGFHDGLMHTIAYTLRGILEAGTLLERRDAQELVIRALNQLSILQRPEGGFSGLYDKTWRSRARWDCLTGTAQTAILFHRALGLNSSQTYASGFERAFLWLKRNQLRRKPPELYGGLCGSYPVFGGYLPYSIPNWAVKFFIDVLLCKIAPHTLELESS